MQPTAELRAMLADPAALRRAQDRHTAAFAAWQAHPAAAPVLTDFAAYGAGAPLAALPALAGLFAQSASADFIGALLAHMLPALAAAPMGQVPLRHAAARGHAALLLAREGDAALNLVAFDGAVLARAPRAPTVAFAPGEEWDAVVAGTGTARLIRRISGPSGTRLCCDDVELAPGTALGRDGEREALVVDVALPGGGRSGPPQGLVMLRLQRRAPGTIPTREYDLASGELVHQADATPRESRHNVAIALLGAMRRTAAAPTLAEIALEVERGEAVRWNALRECLGLDTAAGFRTLCTIARAPHDPLAHVAGALRAQLVEQHPVLAEIDPCLA